MRLVNHHERAALLTGPGLAVDLHRTNPAFPIRPEDATGRISEISEWIATNPGAPAEPIDHANFGPPSGIPRQVFGIGLNYRSHAIETGAEIPDEPMVFTKFPSCITGPNTTVTLTSRAVDWEGELVLVIGEPARNVARDKAWNHVAGLCIGQDLSDRLLQMQGKHHPQYSLGKSLPGFGPIGPALVTVDELDNPDDLELTCSLNGEVVQCARTSDMIFSVPQLIEKLSARLPLLPGDLIFTGTPAGVGAGRRPMRFLTPGDELITTIDGLGSMRTVFTAATIAE